MDVQQIREEVDRIKSALTRHLPFCSSLIRRTRIRVATLPPHSGGAGVDREGVIWIDPEKWERIPFEEKGYILAHEALHVATYQTQRVPTGEETVWNLASDVVVNHALSSLPLRRPQGAVTGEELERMKLLPKEWEQMTTEEVHECLKKAEEYLQTLEELLGKCGTGRDQLGGNFAPPSDAPTVQEGDRELYGGSASREDRQRLWREALAQAVMAQKLAGTLPAGLERWFDQLVRPKLSVRALLRQAIKEGIGKTVVGSWHRPSRKHPEMPWIRRFTTPNIWALVDTSGSIGEQELSLFVGTLYEFASQTQLRVTCWDAEAYETVQARSRAELLEKLRRAMKGGGGTVIAPALERTLERMRPMDVAVVLSDGYISDWDDEKTRELLSRVASRASKAIFLTTGEEKQHPGWVTLRLA